MNKTTILTNLKLFLLSFLLILICFSSSYSQNNKAKDIIYIDFGFNLLAVGIGINYERVLNDNFSFRAGVNIAAMFLMNAGLDAGISLPVTINAMTGNKNKFSVGLGLGPRINLTREGEFKSPINIFPAANIGYRYQPNVKDIFVKTGIDFPANTYFSILSVGVVK